MTMPDPSPKWHKQTFKLPDNLDLGVVTPGYNVFIADRGAVGFHYPRDWVVRPGKKGSIEFHDREPPDDNCVLQLSVIRLPPIKGGWGRVPLDALVRKSIGVDRRRVTRVGEVVSERRPEFELAWVEVRFTDSKEKRAARFRTCLARANLVQPLITMDFWESDAARFAPVWDEVLRSLRVGIQLPEPPPPGWN
jgi:hypothetical protein